MPIVFTAYLFFLAWVLLWAVYRLFIVPSPATRIKLKVEKHTMSFNVGDVKQLDVAANGALSAAPAISVVPSDPAICSVVATADPLVWTLTFHAAGTCVLNASAVSSSGSTVTGSLSVDAVVPAATALTLTVV